MIGEGDLDIEWSQFQIQHGQLEIHCQGAGRGSVDKKLLRQNIRSKENSIYTDLAGFLAEDSTG